MNRSIPMAVKTFEAPADRYKVGTVFMAWLSGHQDHFRMLTDRLGLFPDPELAAHRMRHLLAIGGVE